jgi:formate/nitrite transporter FocA (FNT family)
MSETGTFNSFAASRHKSSRLTFAMSALVGAILFPVGFSMSYLLGFDLLTGVFVLAPLALIDKRPGVT